MANSDIDNDTRIDISTPLDDEVTFKVAKLKAIEAISKPFVVEIFMYCPTSNVPDDIFDKMVGGKCSVTIKFYNDRVEGDDPKNRYFSGIVGEMQYAGEKIIDSTKIYTQYKLKLYPSFWVLKYSKNYQIFSNQKSTDIIDTFFGAGANNIDYSIDVDDDESIEEREYSVQYGETDFDFLSRLMEEDGIFYYFEHDHNAHTMHIGNANDHFKILEAMEDSSLTFTLSPKENPDPKYQPVFNVLTKGEVVQKVVVDQYVAMDCDFEQSPGTTDERAPLNSQYPDNTESDNPHIVREYPSGYKNLTLGDKISQRRFESTQMPKFNFLGESTCPFLSAGYVVQINGPEMDSWKTGWNEEYVIHSVTHIYDFESRDDQLIYSNKFSAFLKTTPFRPARITPKSKFCGSDTAIVIGTTQDTEIHTDQYARIKVRFNWDHQHNNLDDDTIETDIAWIRVTQTLAGEGFGTLFTPRVGHEVLINYIAGNPDAPVVVGALYNFNNMPRYRSETDMNPAVSSIRTQSTPNNPDGFNEIRFDDTSDNEELYIHAQKDMNTEILNNESVSVGGDKLQTIAGNYDLMVGGDFNITVGGNLNIMVAQATGLTTGIGIVISAGAGIQMTAGGLISTFSGLFTSIISTLSVSITSLAANVTVTTLVGPISVLSNMGITMSAGAAILATAGAAVAVTAGSAVAVTAGAAVNVTSGAAMTLTSAATIAMTSAGACTVTGTVVTLNGATSVMLTAPTCLVTGALAVAISGLAIALN